MSKINCPHCGEIIELNDEHIYTSQNINEEIRKFVEENTSASTYQKFITSEVKIGREVLDVFVFDVEDYMIDKLQIVDLAASKVEADWKAMLEEEIKEEAVLDYVDETNDDFFKDFFEKEKPLVLPVPTKRKRKTKV